MSIFDDFFDTHNCKWNEESRHFTPKIIFAKDSVKVPAMLYEKLTWGYTTVMLKCSECGDIKAKEIIGDVTI